MLPFTPSTSTVNGQAHPGRVPVHASSAGDNAVPAAGAQRGVSPLLRAGLAPDRPAQVFTIFSAKGGDGKSWVTAGQGALQARIAEKSVLIIDNDMNSGRQGLHFNLTADARQLYNLAVDYAANKGLDEALLTRRVVSVTSVFDKLEKPSAGRLDLLPGITDITEATRPELAGPAGQRLLQDVITLARRLYDLVLVDSGSQPFLGAHAGALAAADRILFVNSTDRTSLLPNQKVMESIVREFRIPRERFTLIINRYNPGDAINLNDVETLMKIPVSVRIHEDLSRVAISALNHGVPFVVDYLNNKASRNKDSQRTFEDLVTLAEEITPDFRAHLKVRGGLGAAWNPFKR
jgi:pilus assembly protein CpaE